MRPYKLILAGSLLILLIYLLVVLAGFAPSKWIKNPARPLGNRGGGIRYSFTGAMSPTKKESAYLHLPSYSAGMLFHVGLFAGIMNLCVNILGIPYAGWLRLTISAVLTAGIACGLFIFLKRVIKDNLRNLSNPDDYFSNLLVTGFQIISLITLWITGIVPVLYLYSSALVLYIPAGKLKHSFYFFSSRIALGNFYGSRGVWPSRGGNNG